MKWLRRLWRFRVEAKWDAFWLRREVRRLTRILWEDQERRRAAIEGRAPTKYVRAKEPRP